MFLHPPPSVSHDLVPPTCGSEQQRAVLAVQVLHGGDAGVAWVPVVEVVQLLSFLPIPEAAPQKQRTAGERLIQGVIPRSVTHYRQEY